MHLSLAKEHLMTASLLQGAAANESEQPVAQPMLTFTATVAAHRQHHRRNMASPNQPLMPLGDKLTTQPATRLVDGPPDVRHVGLLHCLLAVAQAQALQDAHVVLPRPRKAAL